MELLDFVERKPTSTATLGFHVAPDWISNGWFPGLKSNFKSKKAFCPTAAFELKIATTLGASGSDGSPPSSTVPPALTARGIGVSVKIPDEIFKEWTLPSSSF